MYRYPVSFNNGASSDSLLFSRVYSSPGPVLLFWAMSYFLFGLVRSRMIAQKNGRLKKMKEEQKFNIILPLRPIPLLLSSVFSLFPFQFIERWQWQ